MPVLTPPLLQPDDVASFNATIVTLKGEPVGLCIKFRRFNRVDHLLHLRPEEGGRLMAALSEYFVHGRHKNVLLSLAQDPSAAASLPKSHPYNTLVSMSPELSSDEAGGVSKKTDVIKSTFADRGEFLVYRVCFKSGDQAEFSLHECVAHNLYPFIEKMIEDADKLFGRAGGQA